MKHVFFPFKYTNTNYISIKCNMYNNDKKELGLVGDAGAFNHCRAYAAPSGISTPILPVNGMHGPVSSSHLLVTN